MNNTFNGTTELVQTATNSSYVNANSLNNHGTTSVEQLQKDLLKMKVFIEDMKTKFTDQIRDLVDELDEEKKARATLHIELERLQKQIQKSSLVNWNRTRLLWIASNLSRFVFLHSTDLQENPCFILCSLSQIPWLFLFHIDKSIITDCSSLSVSVSKHSSHLHVLCLKHPWLFFSCACVFWRTVGFSLSI